MLFADAAVFTIDLPSAIALGGGIGGGILGAARLLIGYLRGIDTDRRSVTMALIKVQKESTEATSELRGAIQMLADRVGRLEGGHIPRKDV